MKIQRLLPFVLLAATLGACSKDKEGSLTVHFKAYYDGQPLPMLTTKPFASPQQLQFTHLSFYLSDLALLDQSSTVSLKDIELVDLSFGDVNTADVGYKIHFDKVAAKNYSGIQLGIGVPPDLNAKQPTDFNSSSPLSNSSYYWPAWNSYIFMQTEGRLDTLGNNSFGLGFAYHTGTNNLYRLFKGTMIPISVEVGKDKEVDIVIDYKKVLDGIDIKSHPLNSNPNDSIQINMLIANLANALTVVQ